MSTGKKRGSGAWALGRLREGAGAAGRRGPRQRAGVEGWAGEAACLAHPVPRQPAHAPSPCAHTTHRTPRPPASQASTRSTASPSSTPPRSTATSPPPTCAACCLLAAYPPLLPCLPLLRLPPASAAAAHRSPHRSCLCRLHLGPALSRPCPRRLLPCPLTHPAPSPAAELKRGRLQQPRLCGGAGRQPDHHHQGVVPGHRRRGTPVHVALR